MSLPPEVQQLALNFLAIFPFLVVTLVNNDCHLVITVHEVHCMGPLRSRF